MGSSVIATHCELNGLSQVQNWETDGLVLTVNGCEVTASTSELAARAAGGRAPYHAYLKDLCNRAAEAATPPQPEPEGGHEA